MNRLLLVHFSEVYALARFPDQRFRSKSRAWRHGEAFPKPIDDVAHGRFAFAECLWGELEVTEGAMRIASIEVWNRESMETLLAMATGPRETSWRFDAATQA